MKFKKEDIGTMVWVVDADGYGYPAINQEISNTIRVAQWKVAEIYTGTVCLEQWPRRIRLRSYSPGVGRTKEEAFATWFTSASASVSSLERRARKLRKDRNRVMRKLLRDPDSGLDHKEFWSWTEGGQGEKDLEKLGLKP